jgi:hypothetical protein
MCVCIYILNGTCSGGYLRPAIVEQDVVLPGFSRCSSWRFPKMGVPLFIIHFNRIVLCKPSILGYIPPFQETSISLWTLQSRRMFYAFYGREWTRMDMVWCTSWACLCWVTGCPQRGPVWGFYHGNPWVGILVGRNWEHLVGSLSTLACNIHQFFFRCCSQQYGFIWRNH